MRLLFAFTIAMTLGLTSMRAEEGHASKIYPSQYDKGQVFNVGIEGKSDHGATIVVRYLGYRCSHCVQQLSYLNSYATQLKKLNISVVAFSSDDEEQCARLVEEMGFDKDVMRIVSDANNDMAKSIGAIRTVDDSEVELHASIVLYNNRVQFSVFSEDPYMDVGQLVAAAVNAKQGEQTLATPNAIDRYLTTPFTIKMIAGPADGIVGPVDLDFNKSPLAPNDLWVVTTDGRGHAMAIVHNAGTQQQVVRLKKDSRASHFMWRTMGIAMGSNGTFATAQNGENGSGDPFYQFMGPTLWSSDTAVFASRYQTDNQILASHLDMLHQSPMCLGIAHDSANVFWVSDGYYGDVCRYDYRDPHEVGGTDHRDGIIRRFSDVHITRGVRGRPAHVALDRTSGWLYFVDPGSNMLLRLNTKSGVSTRPLVPPDESGEFLTEFTEWTGAEVDTMISSGLGEPVGLEITGNRILVGDRLSGAIHVYEIGATTLTKIGTIQTQATELLGLCVDARSVLWFVDRQSGTVNVLQTSSDSRIVSGRDVQVAQSGDLLPFTYVNTGTTDRSVQLSIRTRIVTPHGFGEWSPQTPLPNLSVVKNAATEFTVPISSLDTAYANEFEVIENDGTPSGGTRASTYCVYRGLRRAVVDDATMETFSISDAVQQTERPGYAFLRSDIFIRAADSLAELRTVLWNGGSFGEISITDDAILQSLLTRKIEVFLIADDPLLLRTDLPNGLQFFTQYGTSLIGAESPTVDDGQRIFSSVPNDSISGGLGNVDCQLPRLNHTRGGEYVPNVLFRTAKPGSASSLRNSKAQSVCVRYDEGTYRTVILGINASRLLDGSQRTALLKNGLIWLEAAAKKDSVPQDTTTSMAEVGSDLPFRIRVLGNPVTDVVRIVLEGEANDVQLGIYSVGGQQLLVHAPVSVHGSVEITMNAQDLATGTYFVIGTTDRTVTHSTIIKK